MALFVCDGESDCGENSSDETHCYDQGPKQCDYENDQCPNLYFVSHDGHCFPFHSLDKIDSSLSPSTRSAYFVCVDGRKMDITFVNDLVFDCGLSGDDEFHLLEMKNSFLSFSCSEPSQIPCRDGHSKCFNISHICIYQLNIFKQLTSCRTGEHLTNCSSFECNSNFKCPAFYCIPWSYVCNGRWDCAGGSDESTGQICGTSRKCISLFHCKSSSLCIHISQTCNDKVDCPGSDDEMFCAESKSTCPLNCQCRLSAVLCEDISLSPQHINLIFENEAVFIQQCFLINYQNPQVFSKLQTKYMSLKHSDIQQFCLYFPEENSFLSLDLRCIEISNLHPSCFQKMKHLLFLDVSLNNISVVKGHLLSESTKLKFVNISENPILHFEAEVFSFSSQILYISFTRDIPAEQRITFPTNAFNLKFLKVFETNYFQLCCFVQELAKCSVSLPWFLSCDSLLPNLILKALFYVFSILVSLCNLLSISIQIAFCRSKQQHNISNGVIVCFINIVDGILSLPLFSVWISDLVYHNNFILYEYKWRSSPLCFFSFGLFLFFSFMSPPSLSFLSFQRLQLVRNPIKTNFKHTSFILKRVGVIFVTTAAVSSFLVFGTVYNTTLVNGALPTALCSPFLDPARKILMVTVLIGIVISWEVVCMTVIFASYIMLMASLNQSHFYAKHNTNSMPLFLQVLLVSLSNIICWIPSAVVYVVSSLVKTYPVQMTIWTTIVIVPINSIVNPIIFCTVAVRNFLKAKFHQSVQDSKSTGQQEHRLSIISWILKDGESEEEK